jgi:hypothetical protein
MIRLLQLQTSLINKEEISLLKHQRWNNTSKLSLKWLAKYSLMKMLDLALTKYITNSMNSNTKSTNCLMHLLPNKKHHPKLQNNNNSHPRMEMSQ